jgi:hypothetical protein
MRKIFPAASLTAGQDDAVFVFQQRAQGADLDALRAFDSRHCVRGKPLVLAEELEPHLLHPATHHASDRGVPREDALHPLLYHPFEGDV